MSPEKLFTAFLCGRSLRCARRRESRVCLHDSTAAVGQFRSLSKSPPWFPFQSLCEDSFHLRIMFSSNFKPDFCPRLPPLPLPLTDLHTLENTGSLLELRDSSSHSPLLPNRRQVIEEDWWRRRAVPEVTSCSTAGPLFGPGPGNSRIISHESFHMGREAFMSHHCFSCRPTKKKRWLCCESSAPVRGPTCVCLACVCLCEGVCELFSYQDACMNQPFHCICAAVAGWGAQIGSVQLSPADLTTDTLCAQKWRKQGFSLSHSPRL